MKTLLIFASAVLLCGCPGKSESKLNSSNRYLPVEILGTSDGCTIYRFTDREISYAPHYFVRCVGAPTTQAMSQQSCGKGCSYEELISTEEGKTR